MQQASPKPDQPPTVTPAAKNANTGHREARRQRPQEVLEVLGRRRAVPSTGTVKPSSTPATVACTPLACTSAQVATASGTSSHHG